MIYAWISIGKVPGFPLVLHLRAVLNNCNEKNSPSPQKKFVFQNEAPRQGYEGAPEAWLEMKPKVIEGLAGLAAGDEVVLIAWLHKAHRNILRLHPRGDKNMPLSGVFDTGTR